MAQRFPGFGSTSTRDRWWDGSGYSVDRSRRSPRILELTLLVAALVVFALAVQAFPVRAGTGPDEVGPAVAAEVARANDDRLASLAAAAAAVSLTAFAAASVVAVVPWSRRRRYG